MKRAVVPSRRIPDEASDTFVLRNLRGNALIEKARRIRKSCQRRPHKACLRAAFRGGWGLSRRGQSER